jgi:hypothetical protein
MYRRLLTRSVVVVAVAVATLAGCGADRSTSLAARASNRSSTTAGPSTDSGRGISVSALTPTRFYAFDRKGALRFTLPAGVLSADGTRLVRAHPEPGRTVVESFTTADGRVESSIAIPGQFEVAAVAADGHRAALADVSYAAANGDIAAGRTTSHLAVLDFSTNNTTTTTLAGNFVPEAFGSGRDSLAAIEFLPADHPVHYRVRIIDLTSPANVSPSLGWNTKTPFGEDMAGLRGDHVATNHGQFLYTLYRSSTGSPFVHALRLDFGGQSCIDLPSGLGFEQAGGAITASPDGQHLYVVSATGKLVIVTTHIDEGVEPKVTSVRDLNVTGTHASIAADSTKLYVALNDRLVTIDVKGLQLTSSPTGAPVESIAAGPPTGVVLGGGGKIWRSDGTGVATLPAPDPITALYPAS